MWNARYCVLLSELSVTLCRIERERICRSWKKEEKSYAVCAVCIEQFLLLHEILHATRHTNFKYRIISSSCFDLCVCRSALYLAIRIELQSSSQRVPCSVLSRKATVTSIRRDRWFFERIAIALNWQQSVCVREYCGRKQNRPIVGTAAVPVPPEPATVVVEVATVSSGIASKPQSIPNKFQNNTQIPLLSPKYVHFYHRFAINSVHMWPCNVMRFVFVYVCPTNCPFITRHERMNARARLPLKNFDRHSIFKSDCNSIGLKHSIILSTRIAYHIMSLCVYVAGWLAAWLTHFINQINK